MSIIRKFLASIEADKKALQAQIEAQYIKASDIYGTIDY